MTLTVKDILQLDGFSKMHLIAGEAGLSRYITSAGIADSEFCPLSDPTDKEAFESEMMIFSSLLFAKEDPSLILTALRYLFERGACAFVCKKTIFDVLPQEIIAYANDNSFPLFQCDTDLYMDVAIFQILDAVRRENDNFFSEKNVDDMIANSLTKEQIYTINKNISLELKKYVMVVYIKSEKENFQANLEHYTNLFYLQRNLNTKSLIFKYKNGLFAIMTTHQEKIESFQIILDQIKGFLSSGNENLYISWSRIHNPYDGMDIPIKESYFTHIASVSEQKAFHSYDKIGEYQLLIPYAGSEVMKNYADSLIQPLLQKGDFYATVQQVVLNDGDIFKAADALSCHHNTVRYRLSKIKSYLFDENISDHEFYARISLAVRLYMLNQL